MDEIEEFDGLVEALAASLAEAQERAREFDVELRGMGSTIADTGREVKVLSGGISRGLKKEFGGLVFDGMKLSDELETVAA